MLHVQRTLRRVMLLAGHRLRPHQVRMGKRGGVAEGGMGHTVPEVPSDETLRRINANARRNINTVSLIEQTLGSSVTYIVSRLMHVQQHSKSAGVNFCQGRGVTP